MKQQITQDEYNRLSGEAMLIWKRFSYDHGYGVDGQSYEDYEEPLPNIGQLIDFLDEQHLGWVMQLKENGGSLDAPLAPDAAVPDGAGGRGVRGVAREPRDGVGGLRRWACARRPHAPYGDARQGETPRDLQPSPKAFDRNGRAGDSAVLRRAPHSFE